MSCTGPNDLLPFKVIYKLHIGSEIYDVNLNSFKIYSATLNTINIIGSATSRISNDRNGYQFISSSNKVTNAINMSFSFFKKWKMIQYDPNGLSPPKCVEDFPE